MSKLSVTNNVFFHMTDYNPYIDYKVVLYLVVKTEIIDSVTYFPPETPKRLVA